MTNLNEAEQALADMARAQMSVDDNARAIANLVAASLPIAPANVDDYRSACVALAAAQDAYVGVVDALEAVA